MKKFVNILLLFFVIVGCSTLGPPREKMTFFPPRSMKINPREKLFRNQRIELNIHDSRSDKKYFFQIKHKIREVIRATYPLADVSLIKGTTKDLNAAVRININLQKFEYWPNLAESSTAIEVSVSSLHQTKKQLGKKIHKVISSKNFPEGVSAAYKTFEQSIYEMITYISTFSSPSDKRAIKEYSVVKKSYPVAIDDGGNLSVWDSKGGVIGVSTKYSTSPVIQDGNFSSYSISKGDLVDAIEKYTTSPIDNKKWLIIISIENYLKTDKVKYSNRSGEIFKRAAQKVFGVRDRHTYFLDDRNATSGSIKDNLDLISKNVKKGDTIYFYYSGHGVPDMKTGVSYLLPSDRRVEFISNDKIFSLDNIYKKLSRTKAKRVIAFIDACFSGRTEEKLLFEGVAPGLIKTKKMNVKNSKITVVAAGKENQFSNSYEEKKHRLFTYYLVKGLLKYNGKNINKIYNYISAGVKNISWEKGDSYLQEPQLLGNRKVRLR